jgi:hypothetical protein
MAQTDRNAGLVANAAFKNPVRAATTANITLSGEQTIDGIALVTGDRAMVKDQTDASENGLYCVDTSTWTRTKDFNGSYDVVRGAITWVNEGTLSGSTLWYVSSADDPTFGTSSITFTFLATGAALNINQTFTAAQRAAWAELTDAATVAVDLDLANNFYVTVTADRTIGSPTNKTAGQTGYFFIEQGGAGGHTTSWHADWNWGVGNSAPSPDETAANKIMFTYLVDWDATNVHIKFIDEF